jgi:histone deacetylase 4/5
MKITPNGYGLMMQKLMAIPTSMEKIIVVLEGGYNLDSIAVSALACLNVLTRSEVYEDNGDEQPTVEGLNAINATITSHQSQWPFPKWASSNKNNGKGSGGGNT